MSRLLASPSRRVTPIVIAATVVLAILFVPGAIRLSTDWFWFREVGFEVVFRTELFTKLALFAGVGLAAFGFLYANLRLCQRGLVPDPLVVRLTPAAPHVDVTAILRRLALPAAAVLAGLIGISAASTWLEVLAMAQRGLFGVADPVFGRDVGFYVFVLPVVATILGVLLTLVVLALLIAVPVYWLRGDIILAPRHVRVEPAAQLHLGMLLAAFFLLTAVQLWLVRIPGLLYSTTGPLYGASHTDLAVRLPALRVQAVVALVAGLGVLVGALRRTVVWYAALAGAAYAVASVVGTVILPAAMQRLIVAPNELFREAEPLGRHLAATRRAWGLHAVTTRPIASESTLTLGDLRANAATLENVRLWDHEPLLQTFGQLQEIRTYYDFNAVDDDRYWIDGRYRQVLLSPRELNADALSTRTFINRHLTYTHGMGLTLSPVNEVTAEGLPVLFVKDLPPVSTVGLPVTRPQIYYGELTDAFVFVNTRQREFDYPAGEGTVYTAYEGRGGVPVNSFFRRALLAVRFASLKVLLTNDITADSRALYRRHVMTRAQAALPFLTFDGDPYIVIDGQGELQWILDAYTTSNRYPYALPTRGGRFDGQNYVRNSVKVVIDAYHGSVAAYVADESDPIVRTYARVFPGALRPMAEMPADLQAHVRYPEDLYRVQTEIYRVYHMDDVETFYHREDEWQIPALDRAGEERAAPFMRRMIMRLPDEERAEFIFMTPYTPRGKDNLAAWMVARSDGDAYGTLVVYQFPRQSLVYGPRQVVNRINQDTEIARQFSLWDQRGSQVIRGELLVIPIEQSLLYVQPVYLRAEGGRIPELKRVVVAYENQVAMDETFDGALLRLFGGGLARVAPIDGEPGGVPVPVVAAPVAAEPVTAAPGAPTTPATAADPARAALAREAMQHFDRAVAAQRAGDWSNYGLELERLGAVLQRLSAASPR